jgi:hypothetical protein
MVESERRNGIRPVKERVGVEREKLREGRKGERGKGEGD